jgi:hypothetical protein
MGAQVLLQEQMKKRMETSISFIRMIADKGKSSLANIIAMYESAVSRHTPETKLGSSSG